MNILSTGTDDIIPDSGQTIGLISSSTIGSSSYVNQSLTYSAGSSYISDVFYQVSSISYLYNKNITVLTTPDLPCPPTGTPFITYSLSSYNGNIVPSWITIGPTSGMLTIVTPNLSSNTSFPFYISSTISGITNVVNKLVTINVFTNWADPNWMICSDTSTLVWMTWNSGYTLTSSTWVLVTSPAAATTSSTPAINTNANLKATADVEKLVPFILIVVTATATATAAIITLFSDPFSSNLWLMVNQIQLFFLLLLTRAFIPDQVITVIVWSKFTLNPYESITFLKASRYGSWTESINFELNNTSLSYLNINSRSTLYNSVSFCAALGYAIVINILIYPLKIIADRWTSEGR